MFPNVSAAVKNCKIIQHVRGDWSQIHDSVNQTQTKVALTKRYIG